MAYEHDVITSMRVMFHSLIVELDEHLGSIESAAPLADTNLMKDINEAQQALDNYAVALFGQTAGDLREDFRLGV